MSLIGNLPNQISLNSMLGELAFMNRDQLFTFGYTEKNTTIYSVSTTWIKPVNCKAIRIIAVGGGGAGGGCAPGGTRAAGGGGGGAYDEKFITNPPNEIVLTIGSGGNGWSSDGGSGGNTTAGSYVLASGGAGGIGGSTASTTIARGNNGGAGGINSGLGDFNFAGNPGHIGEIFGTRSGNNGGAISGRGGMSPLYRYREFLGIEYGAGSDGRVQEGGATNLFSSDGKNGAIIITTYF